MPCRYPHRNLDDREFSLPAIDNVISRGRWRDWADLRRIKGVLILKRNAARDYIDFAALADRLGNDRVVAALRSFDRLYPQESGESALQQLQSQLANPLPYDEKTTDLSKYRNLDPKWHDWRAIKTTCKHVSIMVFDRVCEESEMDDPCGADQDVAIVRGAEDRAE